MSLQSAHDLRWCPECADERPFETPPCDDGHGTDCLDLMCLDCGYAVVVGVLVDGGEPVLVELVAA
jgi:hypothetical protein